MEEVERIVFERYVNFEFYKLKNNDELMGDSV